MSMRIIWLLTIKNVKTFLRQESVVLLFVMSLLIVHGVFYAFYASTRGKDVHLSSSDRYPRLNVDIECKVDDSDLIYKEMYCNPRNGSNLEFSKSFDLGTLISSSFSSSTQPNKIAARVIGMMMNSVPLLDVPDYIQMSKLINRNVGSKTIDSLLNYPLFGDIFQNLLHIEGKELVLSPINCWTQGFAEYLRNYEGITDSIKIFVRNETSYANDSENNTWAVVEIDSLNQVSCAMDASSSEQQLTVTIRMKATTVPDTRNLFGSSDRYLSGHVLYFASGFLSVQLEIQNYLAKRGRGGVAIHTKLFSGQALGLDGTLPISNSRRIMRDLVRSEAGVMDIFSNATEFKATVGSSVSVPLSYRAFRTHKYKLSFYWHSSALLATTAFVLLFSLPGTLAAGWNQKEFVGDQLSLLSTMPKVRYWHSACAWCLCSWILLLPVAAMSWAYFAVTLKHTWSILPAFVLLLGGCSIGPLCLILGTFVKKPESLIVEVPLLVFVLMLPGLLYNDLVFDTQRSRLLELFISSIPPSGAAMLLRQIYSIESTKTSATLLSTMPVTGTLLKELCLMLILDLVIFSCLAMIWLSSTTIWSRITFLLGIPPWIAGKIGNIFGNIQTMLARSTNSGYQIIEMTEHLDSSNLDIEFGRVDTGDSYHNIVSSPVNNPSIDFLEEGAAVVQIRNLTKSFPIAGKGRVEILTNISAELNYGKITCFLGGNGAGKSTLMNILCGLDSNFAGDVNFIDMQRNEVHKGRRVGWCPQVDALFDFLTVREHLFLYLSLDSQSPVDDEDIHRQVDKMLTKLNLIDSGDRLVLSLSGGMKRRLSLALAFVGNPSVLLLDEPTTGCDSYTREFVRQDIVENKSHAAVLVSTHHMDDIEILADWVWFLNENHLNVNYSLDSLRKDCFAFSGNISAEFEDDKKATNPFASSLHNHPVNLKDDMDSHAEPKSSYPSFTDAENKYQPSALEFSTACPRVKELFSTSFGRGFTQLSRKSVSFRLPRSKLSAESEAESISTWLIPIERQGLLRRKLDLLERRCEYNWHVSAPSLGDALVLKSNRLKGYKVSPKISTIAPSVWNIYSEINSRMPPICIIRLKDIIHNKVEIFRLHLVIPFIVVLCIAMACGNVVYPSLTLSSQKILGGLGEIILGFNSQEFFHNSSNNDIFLTTNRANSTAFDVEPPRDLSYLKSFNLQNDNLSLSCRPMQTNSDALQDLLFSNYRTHASKRYAAFIVNDTIDDWMDTVVSFGFGNTTDAAQELYRKIHLLKQSYCPQLTDTEDMFRHRHKSDEIVGGGMSHEYGMGNYSLISHDNSLLCALNATIRLQQNMIDLKSVRALNSQLTMLTNVSFDHVAPILLKEVATGLYQSFFKKKSIFETRQDGLFDNKTNLFFGAPNYALYSSPLPLSDYPNKVYLARGYIGTVMVILFCQILTISSVKFVVGIRQQKVRLQLQLSGVSFTNYWLCNYVVDVSLLIISLYCIFAALWAAYCLQARPVVTLFGLNNGYSNLFQSIILLFSCAVVSSSYACSLKISDSLSAQLMLLVWNILSGVVLRLFIDSNQTTTLVQFSRIWKYVSPSFAFTTAMFDLVGVNMETYLPVISAKPSIVMKEIYSCKTCLAIQSLFYLLVVIAADYHANEIDLIFDKVQQFISRLRKSVSGLFGLYDHVAAVATHLTHSQPFVASRARILKSSPTLVGADRRERKFINPAIRKSGSASQLRSERMPIEQPISFISKSSSMRSDKFDVSTRTAATIIDNPGSDSLLKLDQITISYAKRGDLAIRNVSLCLDPGERVALVGINGGGKSTLFQTMALGQIRPVNGRAFLNGLDLIRQAPIIAANNLIGYVPQDGGLLGFLTVGEHLELFSRLTYGPPFDPCQQTNNEWGEFKGKYWDYPASSLSGGCKKKLLLSLAQLTKPKLLLLDECTSGVDPLAAASLVLQLQSSSDKSKQALLFASHSVEECIALCSRVVLLNNGEIIFDGSSVLFESLSTQFYQVDVVFRQKETKSDVFPKYKNKPLVTLLNELKRKLPMKINSDGGRATQYERTVSYGSQFFRITAEKSIIPFTVMWQTLDQFLQSGVISRYSFRDLEMEEVLALLISSAKRNTTEHC